MTTRGRTQLGATFALVVAVVLTCATEMPGAGAASSAPTGVVVGHFLFSPPMSGALVPINGTITLTPSVDSRPSVRVKVGRSGTFVVRVATGTWVVTGESPRYQGAAGPAVCRTSSGTIVRANQRTPVSVVCEGL